MKTSKAGQTTAQRGASHVATGDLVRLLERLSREVAEIESHPNPRPGEKCWSVQIFPSDTGVCLAYGDTLHEAGWKAIGELDAKRA